MTRRQFLIRHDNGLTETFTADIGDIKGGSEAYTVTLENIEGLRQLPAPQPLHGPINAELWRMVQNAAAQLIANPADPHHWIHHYNPDLDRHDMCECEER